MQDLIFTDFKVSYDFAYLKERLRIKNGSGAEDKLRELLKIAEPISAPKAVVRVVKPELIDEDKVKCGETIFRSGLLNQQLGGEDSLALAFVATCGRELDAWAQALTGIMEQFMAEEIMINCLRQGRDQLEERIRESYGFEVISDMNPGSLPTHWPIYEQKPLFEFLGELPGKIEVELLPSFLMSPPKTVSGIYFPTREKFHNCQLCTKKNCPSRKAPYQD